MKNQEKRQENMKKRLSVIDRDKLEEKDRWTSKTERVWKHSE